MQKKVSVKEVTFYMRNVRTRMPFKYGVASLTSVPILHVLMKIEGPNGKRAEGVAADILPPKWFDKDPAKDYEENVDDLLYSAKAAESAFMEASKTPRTVFDIWQEGYHATLAAGDSRGLNHLTSSHGSTLMERALIDGLGCLYSLSYHQMLTDNVIGIRLGDIHSELADSTPAELISVHPAQSAYVRHTVGLADPISDHDIPASNRLNDGLPQSLETYIRVHGLRYLKVKVNGQLERDLERLHAIADVLDRSGEDYRLTLDGNEQYKDMDSFLELMDRMSHDKSLSSFYDRILFIEQPLDRGIALDDNLSTGIRSVAERKPMLVDESDGDLNTYKDAIALGYRGVSTKNCKGLIKAVANQGLARHYGKDYFLSAEDLMNLPIVPLQQDLTHIAALGISHVERNGHHYVHGLDHLSDSERADSRLHHGTLYRNEGTSMVLDIHEGRVNIASLQCPGLGVAQCTDTGSMIPIDAWEYSSLA